MILKDPTPVHVRNPKKIKRKHGGEVISAPESKEYKIVFNGFINGFDSLPYGYESRLASLNNSQTITLSGKLHADLFNSDKMLMNGVYMDIKLTRAPEAFYILGPTDDTKVRIKIEDATLYIDQAEINPPISH
jgi:hypothetical protein